MAVLEKTFITFILNFYEQTSLPPTNCSCQCKNGLGSDVGIIIESSIILIFVHRKYRLTLHGLLFYFLFVLTHV